MQVNAPEAVNLTVELLPHMGSDLQPSLSLRSTCDDAFSEGGCVRGGQFLTGARLVRTRLAPGTYYVLVDGHADTRGAFTLRASVAAPAAPPANDACGAVPEELVLNPATGALRVTGSTYDAFDDAAGSCSADGAQP